MVGFSKWALLALLSSGLTSALQGAASLDVNDSERLVLRENWTIQSSDNVVEADETISKPGFQPHGWYPASMPTTVLSALVKDNVYSDPYTGMNLRAIPGTEYPMFAEFANLMMSPTSPFRHSWWYHTEFKLPVEYRGRRLRLGFDGINYRANVWMNGVRIASSENVAGIWRLFEFDVTATARPGQANALAVEVFPPQPNDLATTFVDWAPMPPDKDMGLWRDVYIAAAGPVSLHFPAVLSVLDLPSGNKASLTVRAEVTNGTNQSVAGVLKGSIGSIEFQKHVLLGPQEMQVIHFSPEEFPQLKVKDPRLWWPAQVGSQELYTLDLQMEVSDQVSDSAHIRFGIRQVTSRVDEHGHLLFQINGKNILIRGAGYSFDMLLRSSPDREEAELAYARDLNLNALRLEGKLVDDHFLDLADQKGILILAGWNCCDQWEHWANWDKENTRTAEESLRDQARRFERHPSVLAWMYGSDNPPPPKVEKMYLDVLRETDWPNPTVSSASGTTTPAGPSGVKMSGPYEYVAPSYWYLDTKEGGAFGFNTETSPGPAIPPIESLRRMIPEDHLWPIDSVWEYHTGGMSRTLKIFTEALDKRYGPSQSAEEYSRKAQVQAYESHRAMMEAYGRNKYESTGIIQWMMNNPWPSMIWHLYDWYLRPGGSYFGVKKALEPLHVQYSYDDDSIVVVNSYYQAFSNLRVSANVYNLDMTQKLEKEVEINVGPDSSTRVFTLPQVEGLSKTYFVRLVLEQSGKVKSTNFYWLSTTPETVDWKREIETPPIVFQGATWAHTKTFADYTALNALPQVDLDASARTVIQGSEAVTTVTLHNPSSSLAFAVRLKVNMLPTEVTTVHAPADYEILPVLWQDNYFPLLPGETRQVTASYSTTKIGGRPIAVEVQGWNVKEQIVRQ
jgi:exo-1,4-beta-D-glucosaminidase